MIMIKIKINIMITMITTMMIKIIMIIIRDQGEVLALSFNPHIQILATGGIFLVFLQIYKFRQGQW